MSNKSLKPGDKSINMAIAGNKYKFEPDKSSCFKNAGTFWISDKTDTRVIQIFKTHKSAACRF